MLANGLIAQNTATSEEDNAPSETTRERLQERLLEVNAALEALRSEDGDGSESGADSEDSADIDGADSDLLERLRGLLEDRLDNLKGETGDATPEDAPVEELWPPEPEALVEAFIGHPRPYNLLEYDRLLDRYQSASNARDLAKEDRTFETEALERAEQNLKRYERERRRLEEEAAGDADFGQELRRTHLQTEIATQRLAIQEQRTADANRHLERAQTVAEHLEKAAAWIVPHVIVTADDEAQHLKTLSGDLAELRQTIRTLRRELENAEANADRARGQVGTGPAQVRNLARSNALQQEVATRSLQVNLIDDRIERLDDLRHAIQIRYRAWREELDRPSIRDATTEIVQKLSALERYIQRRRSELEQATIDRRSIDSTLDVQIANQSTEAARWSRKEREILQQKIKTLQDTLQYLNEERRLLDRIRGELLSRVRRLSPGEQAARFWTGLKDIWTFELIAVQDNSITVGKILISILLLILGFTASRRLSRFLAQRLFTRLGLDPSVIAALQTLTFYAALIGVFLLALWLVNIPLTVFTFLGGALAIGVGFGSQNIVNNFISGLILMIERPVKVGDLIEVDGLSGLVQKIGARSTQILSGDNTHLIIPNSSFLEGNVLNWTLSDQLRRSEIDFGVAYGSPTHKVKALLLQAADENEDINSHPAPEVIFMDFGDSALLFRLFFWTRIARPADLLRRQSELRFRIDELCREQGIEIPFPQRDLHLRTDSTRRRASEPEGDTP